MRRPVILGPFIVVLMIVACSDDESAPSQVDYRLGPTWQATDSIRYSVEGGGNIDYTVEDAADSFTVHVSSYLYETKDEFFSLSKSGVAPSTVDLLEAMFEGTVNIGGTIYHSELETGTWTFVYVNRDSDWLRVANESIIEDLRPLDQLVREHLEAGSHS